VVSDGSSPWLPTCRSPIYRAMGGWVISGASTTRYAVIARWIGRPSFRLPARHPDTLPPYQNAWAFSMLHDFAGEPCSLPGSTDCCGFLILLSAYARLSTGVLEWAVTLSTILAVWLAGFGREKLGGVGPELQDSTVHKRCGRRIGILANTAPSVGWPIYRVTLVSPACASSRHATAIPECLGIQDVARLRRWAPPCPGATDASASAER